MELFTAETAAKKEVKDLILNLDQKVLGYYAKLNENDIYVLVISDKWHSAIYSGIDREISAMKLALVDRLVRLGDRYHETVDDLQNLTTSLGLKVMRHLEDMGVKR
ncbi:hypothetical protein ACL1E5_14420 [Corynebacterium striatum]